MWVDTFRVHVTNLSSCLRPVLKPTVLLRHDVRKEEATGRDTTPDHIQNDVLIVGEDGPVYGADMLQAPVTNDDTTWCMSGVSTIPTNPR